MISFDQMKKAMQIANIHATDTQVNNVMLAVLPNPQVGFSCAGVNVWGDTRSIDEVRGWQHAAIAHVPALEAALVERGPPPPADRPDDCARCCNCGTYPKGYYTCQTCVAADEHEGEQEHISDWPQLS